MKRNHFFALMLLASSLTMVTAEAAEPPPPAPPKPFTVPETTRFTLDNGLNATLIPYGELPKVTVQVVVRAGNLNEGDQRWLADFTASLLEEGTAERDAQQIATDVAAMGGELFTRAGLDEMTVGGDVLAEFAPDLVALLAEIVQSPALPESEAERIRADLLRQLDVTRARAQSQAQEAFLGTIYGTHPYGDIFPEAAQLESHDAADARSFHEREFGARRTHVYVAGRFDATAVRQAVEDAFSGWKPGPKPLIDVPESRSGHQLVLVDRPDAPQSSLVLGLPVVDPSHPDHVPLQVMNALLGGSFSSRITSNIREDKGYTYSPFSLLRDNYRATIWAQHADVTTEHTADSLQEIFNEINRLRSEPPAAAELDGIQNYLSGLFVLRNSDRMGIINQLRNVALHELPPDYLSTYVQRVHAVTPEQVSAMAQKYLTPENMALVVVGDLKTVKPQLEGLDWIQDGG